MHLSSIQLTMNYSTIQLLSFPRISIVISRCPCITSGVGTPTGVLITFILISDDSQVPAVICKLPPMRGHCRALLIRWRYDPVTKKCQEFKFGGCDGNANNFQSQKACMTVCAGERFSLDSVVYVTRLKFHFCVL